MLPDKKFNHLYLNLLKFVSGQLANWLIYQKTVVCVASYSVVLKRKLQFCSGLFNQGLPEAGCLE